MNKQRPVSEAPRVAVVTGGSRGIGLGIAQQLCDRGYHVVANGVRPESSVTGVLQDLSERGGEVCYCQGDISDADDRRRIVAEAVAKFGRIDVLVNNAGVAPKARTDILEATEESFERLMRINLQGPFFLTQLVAQQMIAARKQGPAVRRPVIITISSVSAVLASVERGDYCMSKAGLTMMSKLWACRLAEYGIQVHEVRPGIIRTEMTAGVVEKYDRLIEGGLTLESRWGTPEDVGRMVATLADGELTYTTGSVWNVDGGMLVPRL